MFRILSASVPRQKSVEQFVIPIVLKVRRQVFQFNGFKSFNTYFGLVNVYPILVCSRVCFGVDLL